MEKIRREEKSDIYASYIDVLPVSASRVSRELSMILTSIDGYAWLYKAMIKTKREYTCKYCPVALLIKTALSSREKRKKHNVIPTAGERLPLSRPEATAEG